MKLIINKQYGNVYEFIEGEEDKFQEKYFNSKSPDFVYKEKLKDLENISECEKYRFKKLFNVK